MGDERPSDAMQPNSKRRAGGQLSRDHDDDDDDGAGNDPGTWQPPTEGGEIPGRRKVKVRRGHGGGDLQPSSTAAPAANPFAGVSLTTGSAAPNPFAGISLTAPANPFAALSSLAPATASTTATTTPADEKGKDAGEAKPAEDAGTEKPAAANAFAALANNAPSSGAFGGGAGAAGTGVGGFKFPLFSSTATAASGTEGAAAPTASLFPPLTSNGGAFTFPPIASSSKPLFEQPAGDNVELFPKSEGSPAVKLPEQKPPVTGEEEEQVVFSADGSLFEFDPSTNKWRERGKGEFRINTDKAGQGRMIMRQAGNLRLLLNAKTYASMAVQKMAGNTGVTFACINAAAPQDTPAAPSSASKEDSKDKEKADKGEVAKEDAEPSTTASKDKKEEGKDDKAAAAASSGAAAHAPRLATWAVRIAKNPDKVDQLFTTLERIKAAAPQQGQGQGQQQGDDSAV